MSSITCSASKVAVSPVSIAIFLALYTHEGINLKVGTGRKILQNQEGYC